MIRTIFFWIGGISAFAAIVSAAITLACISSAPLKRVAVSVGKPFKVPDSGIIIANMNSSDSSHNGSKEIHISLVKPDSTTQLIATGNIDCHQTENWCNGKSASIEAPVSKGDVIVIGVRGSGIKIKTNETAFYFQEKNCPWSTIGM